MLQLSIQPLNNWKLPLLSLLTKWKVQLLPLYNNHLKLPLSMFQDFILCHSCLHLLITIVIIYPRKLIMHGYTNHLEYDPMEIMMAL